jgi:hypothetical protein
MFTFSAPALVCISASESRVNGCTIIVELPTAIMAVLLKPVDTIVFCATSAPDRAGTNTEEPARFNCTSPENSRIIPFSAQRYAEITPNITTAHKTFFMPSSFSTT